LLLRSSDFRFFDRLLLLPQRIKLGSRLVDQAPQLSHLVAGQRQRRETRPDISRDKLDTAGAAAAVGGDAKLAFAGINRIASNPSTFSKRLKQSSS
jgi:hypothetical protein